MYTNNHFLNHYGILDFQQIVGIDEVKKAYRILAKRCHPDVNPTVEAQEKMKAINAAYEILSNPQHKALYDEQYREYISGYQREKEFTQYYQKTRTHKTTKADNFYRVFAWIIFIVIFRLIAAADKQSYSNRNNNSYTYTSKR